MRIIQLDAFRDASIIEGFDGWILRDLIDPIWHEQLHQSFPATFLRTTGSRSPSIRSEESFGYLGGCLDIYELDQTSADRGLSSLDPTWRTLTEELLSDSYNAEMAALTGVSLHSTQKKIRFFRYCPGGFLDSHFDNQRYKVLTQIVYSNLHWEPSWGGYLDLLSVDTNGRETVLHSLPPLVSYSVINRSTVGAYHRVTMVTDAARAPRQSLLLEWYSNGQ
jgi:Rps23 Pro-64 3,4-dihydroxylase Tpa1-like proline 4-hydroxylase